MNAFAQELIEESMEEQGERRPVTSKWLQGGAPGADSMMNDDASNNCLFGLV